MAVHDYWIVKLGPDVLLPITVFNFSGEVQGKQNLLHWTTATEENNTGFEVQRSSDGINFKKIGFVNTKAINGNSSEIQIMILPISIILQESTIID